MQSRKTLPPATGTVRWLPDDPCTGAEWLRITVKGVSQDYELERVEGGFCLYRLDPKTFEVIRYRIDTTWGFGMWSCDCPDSLNRPERFGNCKHCRAVKAAINALPF